MWAQIDASTQRVVELTELDPKGRFHPSLRWLAVPNYLTRWANSSYVERGGVIVPASLDALRDQLKAEVTALRWTKEAGGIVTADGLQILTETSDQDRIDTALSNMERYGLSSVDFKAASGFVTVTYDQLKAIGRLIVLHVQGCFTAERDHYQALDKLDSIEAICAYDYTQGWPVSAKASTTVQA